LESLFKPKLFNRLSDSAEKFWFASASFHSASLRKISSARVFVWSIIASPLPLGALLTVRIFG